MVELRGLEPLTACLQSRCSSQLSYSPRGFRSVPVRRSGPDEPSHAFLDAWSHPVRCFATLDIPPGVSLTFETYDI